MQVQRLEVDAGGPPGGAGETQRVRQNLIHWRAVVQFLRSPVDDFITTVFPADCRICEAPLEHAAQVPVCDACLSRIAPDMLPGCRRCGDFAGFDLDFEDIRFAAMSAELLCRECRLAPPPFARAVSFGVYEEELRELVHLLKFSGVRGAAARLGDCLAEAILKLEPEAGRELLVVPVPLFRARERQRGFNQSALLARRALRRLKRVRPAWKLAVSHGILTRQKSTESQYELSRRGRRRNLRGAFAVTGEVRGREVLLVDDILTSGATARECARVLRTAGATRVWVATVARAGMRTARKKPFETTAWDLPVSFAGAPLIVESAMNGALI